MIDQHNLVNVIERMRDAVSNSHKERFHQLVSSFIDIHEDEFNYFLSKTLLKYLSKQRTFALYTKLLFLDYDKPFLQPED